MKINLSSNEISALAEFIKSQHEGNIDGATDSEILIMYIKDEVETQRGDGKDVSEDDVLVELQEQQAQSWASELSTLLATNETFAKFTNVSSRSKSDLMQVITALNFLAFQYEDEISDGQFNN